MLAESSGAGPDGDLGALSRAGGQGDCVKECSKSIQRRLGDSRFVTRYFRGKGIDIGGRPDPLALYRELFSRIEGIRTWDIEDGSAQCMEGVADDSFDFVHSSHCLEHLDDPCEGLKSWLRILKPGGYLVVLVPDEDLYEQGVFPGTFNRDHRWTFTICKASSWSTRSLNLLDLVRELGPEAEVHRIELLDETYRYELPRYDQTLTPIGESGIELVLRKRQSEELERGGRLPGKGRPEHELRVHLNQYRDDRKTLRRASTEHPPFENDGEI